MSGYKPYCEPKAPRPSPYQDPGRKLVKEKKANKSKEKKNA